MKVNYVLMYGTPYLKYREFETFEDVSKFLVNKGIVNYSIFKKLEDKEEVEMIYRDNDIKYLKGIIKEVREYIKENMSYIEKGKLEYIPSGEDILKILDKAINNKQVMPVEESEEYEPKNIAEQEYQDWFWD